MLGEYFDNWDHYNKILRGLSPLTCKAYRTKAEEFFNWLAGSGRAVEFADITRQDVEAFLEYLFYKQNNANVTRFVKLGALSSFWRFLQYENIVKEDITAHIPRPRIKRRFIQDFTKTEIIKFFRCVDVQTEKGLRDVCILIVLSFGGLRVGEVCGIRLNDIVDDGEYIDIQLPEDIVKQQSFRTVDLWKAPSVFLRHLVALRLNHGATGNSPFFVSYRKGDKIAGNPLTEKDIDRLVKKLGQAAGIRRPRIHSHMFRATHGSDLRHIKGYDIAAIAARLGHKNISTTNAYLTRGRIQKQYRSLRDYWLEWENLWKGGAGE